MEENNIEKTTDGAESTLNVKDILFLCLSKWYWFVISLALCMGVATYHLLTTPPVYSRTASILIKDSGNRRGNSGGVDNQFADLRVFNTSTNVNNEIRTMKSADLMAIVVKRLGLEMNYYTAGRFHKQTLYGRDLPVFVNTCDIPDKSAFKFDLDLEADGRFKITNFVVGDSLAKDLTINGELNDSIDTPAGTMMIMPNLAYTGRLSAFDKTIYVSKSSLASATSRYLGGLSVTQSDEKSNIIDLSDQDVSTQRAEDILTTLISVYNENWVKDKNQIAVSTSMFINDRLVVIEGELGNVDSDIAVYKSEKLMPDVAAAGSMAVQQANQAQQSIQNLNQQLYMARYVRNYLANSANNTDLLPVGTGMSNSSLASQITSYNQQLMERNSLAANSSEKNPLVQEADVNLSMLRSALLTSIDNEIISLNAQIQSQKQFGGQALEQVASNPKQAKYLLSVERQQKVKESLYLYLLQKREENELSQAFTAYNTRVIDKPHGSNVPISPKKQQTLLIAFVLGLAIPAGLIVLREMLNTKVRGRKDLENMKAPMVGELPLVGKQKGLSDRILEQLHIKKAAPAVDNLVVVKDRSRNVINEAFRVVRTNLEFMVGKDKTHVIAITSANPGSGKTFTSFNLALALAIKKKRVLVIDLDLRRGSLSKYIGSPKPGVANYLAGQTDSIEKITYHYKDIENLNIIPVGVMPPNPAELLFSDRLAELIEEMRKHYDFIFIDCPPVEVVADASIINKLVDITIFVVKAGLFERSMLVDLDKAYTKKKYNNLCVLLNGTISSSAYGYRYGYRYGYNYGYGSGRYGGYISEKDN